MHAAVGAVEVRGERRRPRLPVRERVEQAHLDAWMRGQQEQHRVVGRGAHVVEQHARSAIAQRWPERVLTMPEGEVVYWNDDLLDLVALA